MKTSFPSGFLRFTVMERLLQLSIVKYRLSAPGTSRSCPRVTSPVGGSSFDDVRPEEAHELAAARACLHVGHVEDPDA